MTPLIKALKQIEKVSVCQIGDALGPTCKLETRIRPLHPHFRVCGTALTVAAVPNDNLTLHHALHLAQPGQVLVVSSGKNCTAALWGELMSLSARKRKLGGTIIDGPARDYWEIEGIDYPVFAREVTPRKASKDKYGSVGAPIRCGCLSVRTGDIIVADVNGILTIPANQLSDAVHLVRDVTQKEDAIKAQISRGRTIFEVLGLERYVPQKERRGLKR